MEVKLTGPKTLNLPSNAVAYILDTLTTRPFREVNDLINEIMRQLKQQEKNDVPEISALANPPADDRLLDSEPADR